MGKNLSEMPTSNGMSKYGYINGLIYKNELLLKMND